MLLKCCNRLCLRALQHSVYHPIFRYSVFVGDISILRLSSYMSVRVSILLFIGYVSILRTPFIVCMSVYSVYHPVCQYTVFIGYISVNSVYRLCVSILCLSSHMSVYCIFYGFISV